MRNSISHSLIRLGVDHHIQVVKSHGTGVLFKSLQLRVLHTNGFSKEMFWYLQDFGRLTSLAFIVLASTTEGSRRLFESTVSSSAESWKPYLRTRNVSGVPLMTSNQDIYNKDLFSPLEDLSVLSETEFTHLSHPEFPHHSIRIKKTPFCDDSVK